MSGRDGELQRGLDRVRRFYAHQAFLYDLTRRFLLPDRLTVIEHMPLTAGSIVLDVGHGTGLTGGSLAAKVGENGIVIGLDSSLSMLRRARKKISHLGRDHILLVAADAASLPLQYQVDAAVFSYSLTIIPAWEEALDEVQRFLQPDGFISVVDFRPLDHYSFPGKPLLTWWFHSCHCHPERPLIEALDRRFTRVFFHQRNRDRHFLYLGKKEGDSPDNRISPVPQTVLNEAAS